MYSSLGTSDARHRFEVGNLSADKRLSAQWKTPREVTAAQPKASILKGGREVFNLKANDFRLVALIQYDAGVLMIRFFGSHEDYDKVNAETV